MEQLWPEDGGPLRDSLGARLRPSFGVRHGRLRLLLERHGLREYTVCTPFPCHLVKVLQRIVVWSVFLFPTFWPSFTRLRAAGVAATAAGLCEGLFPDALPCGEDAQLPVLELDRSALHVPSLAVPEQHANHSAARYVRRGRLPAFHHAHAVRGARAWQPGAADADLRPTGPLSLRRTYG